MLLVNALCTCSRGFWQHENPNVLPIHFLWIIRISRAYSFLHWKRASLKFFWIIFKIKFKSFHERWSSLVGDMKHNLRGNMKIISINILAYRCLWNNKQPKTKMLIPKRKLRENIKLTYTSRMTTLAWKSNKIFSFSERWNDQGDGELPPPPQNQLFIAHYHHINILYLPFTSSPLPTHPCSLLNRKISRKTSIFLSFLLRATTK